MNGPLAYPRVPQKPPLPPRPRQPSMQHCLVHTEIAMPGIGGQARKFIVAHVDQRFVIPRFEIDVRLTIDVIIYNQRNVITGSKRRDRASVAVVEYEAQPFLLPQLRPTPELGLLIRKHYPLIGEIGKGSCRGKG